MFVFVICGFFPVEWPSVHISWLHYFFREVKQRYWSSNTSPFPLLGKQTKVTQIKDFLNSEGTLFATAIKCWKSTAVAQYWRFLCHLFPQSVGQKWSLKCVEEKISDISAEFISIPREFSRTAEKWAYYPSYAILRPFKASLTIS